MVDNSTMTSTTIDSLMIDSYEEERKLRDQERRQRRLIEKTEKRLFAAAERNDLDAIKAIVANDKIIVPLSSTDHQYAQTVAHFAAKNGHLDIVKYVADTEPAILAYRNRYGDTVFHLPNEKVVMDIIKYLEEKYNTDVPEWDRQDFESMALHAAAKFRHWEVLKYFFEKRNSDVNARNDQGETPIFTAVKYKHNDVFKYLVEERNANLTALDENKDNILYMAITADDLPTMKYILDERKANIDMNWQNNFKNTLVHRAVILDRLSILEYLVEQKHADVNILGHENRTALNQGCKRNFYEICKYLVEHGANPEIKDKFGYYPDQIAFDKKVMEYMKNVSNCGNRSRRSIDLQLIQLRTPAHKLSKIMVGNGLHADSTTFSADSYSSQLLNFLVMAQWGIRRMLSDTPNRRSSNTVTLHSEMDLTAVNAIQTLPNFFDE